METREPEVAYGKTKLTIQEYLRWEREADGKHEYYRGEIFAMAGARIAHNIIATNLTGILQQRLRGKACRPFNSDQRIHIPGNTLFTYPDLSVICGKPITLDNDEWNILNPSILVEVLSSSTRNHDRGEKFKLYRDVPSLREYVLIDSETVAIELFCINKEARWELLELKDAHSHLTLATIDVSIPLADIYEGTGLTEGGSSEDR